jgi:hypothetical protein
MQACIDEESPFDIVRFFRNKRVYGIPAAKDCNAVIPEQYQATTSVACRFGGVRLLRRSPGDGFGIRSGAVAAARL